MRASERMCMCIHVRVSVLQIKSSIIEHCLNNNKVSCLWLYGVNNPYSNITKWRRNESKRVWVWNSSFSHASFKKVFMCKHVRISISYKLTFYISKDIRSAHNQKETKFGLLAVGVTLNSRCRGILIITQILLGRQIWGITLTSVFPWKLFYRPCTDERQSPLRLNWI